MLASLELPWLALSESVLGGRASNAASEGCQCHSIAQLIMSDLQTSMRTSWVTTSPLWMIVCLRDGKEAVVQLKAIY
jgi:hypothetical protein